MAADSRLGFIRSGEVIQQVGFDSAGNIVTAGRNEIAVWDAITHEKIRSITPPDSVYFVQGRGVKQIAIAGGLAAWFDPDEELWVADLGTGEVREPGVGNVAGVGIDGSGRHIGVVTVTGDVLMFADGEFEPRWTSPGIGFSTTGELADHLGLNRDPATESFPPSGTVVFNAAGTKVYVSRGYDVRVLDTESGEVLVDKTIPGYFRGSGSILLIPLQSDESRVLIGDAETVALLDLSGDAGPEMIPNIEPTVGFSAVEQAGDDTFALVDAAGSVVVFDASGRVLFGPVDLNVGSTWSVQRVSDAPTIAIAGESGVALLAIDGSGLLRATAAVPADYATVTALTDRLIYASPTELTRSHVGTGTYWRCDPACTASTEIPQAPLDMPYAAVNGWIPVVEFAAEGPVWKIYDKAGQLHAKRARGRRAPGWCVRSKEREVDRHRHSGRNAGRVRPTGLDEPRFAPGRHAAPPRRSGRARPVARPRRRLRRRELRARHDYVDVVAGSLGVRRRSRRPLQRRWAMARHGQRGGETWPCAKRRHSRPCGH